MSESAIRAAEKYVAAKYRRRGDETVFVVDPHVQKTAGGRSIVYLRQQYRGIPVFGGDLSVRVGRRKVIDVLGDISPVVPAGDGTPDISATDAVSAAIAHFRAGSDRSVCNMRHPSRRASAADPGLRILASFPFPSRPTVFRIGRTDSSPAAYLSYWPDGEGVRLVWLVRTPFRAQSYLLVVVAEGKEKGRVILCTRWSAGARCFGKVFSWDHAAGPVRMELPLPKADFPPLLPHDNAAFLGPWVATDVLAGNNAEAFDGNKSSKVKAAMSGQLLEFPSFAPKSKEQTLLNAFFYCNVLHDFFLLLGFGEEQGNFQLKNFATTKGQKDRLEVRVFQKKHPNIADMDARDDGKTPTLSLGLAPKNNEPSGLHAELVIHEYTHGVVHRMVGGRLGPLWLIQQQSLAMDEGWADYFAITLRNRYLGQNNPNYRFVDWAGDPTVRSASYAPNVQRDYAKIKPPLTHAGEVFAAALIRFNELLGARLGDFEKGHCIGWRAVVESLHHVPPNPTFLQGRDALIDAIDELRIGNVITTVEASHARSAAKEGFAKYGMGKNARSVNAAFGGITSDFNP